MRRIDTKDQIKSEDREPARLCFGDGPAVDYSIRRLCKVIHRSLSPVARAKLLPDLVANVYPTAGDWATSERRCWMLVDAAVRVFAPQALRSVGLFAEAARLEALSKVSREGARAVSFKVQTQSDIAKALARIRSSAPTRAYGLHAAADACAFAASAAYNASMPSGAERASDAAAEAAFYACQSIATADVAGGDSFIESQCIPLLHQMIAAGLHPSSEPVCWACQGSGSAMNDRGDFMPCPVCNWHALRELVDEGDDEEDGAAALRNAMWIGLATIALIVLGWICW